MEFYLSAIINLIILVVTIYIISGYFKERVIDGNTVGPIWNKQKRFFTTLSNLFSAIACGIYLVFQLTRCVSCGVVIPHWVVLLKYFSASTVAVTFFTVLLYLGPTTGYDKMYGGTSLFTHLIGPLLAVVAFCFLEKGPTLTWEENFVAVIPMLAYGLVYTRQVIFASERDESGNLIKGWEDFYYFTRMGHWIIPLCIMTAATFAVAIGVRLLHNM